MSNSKLSWDQLKKFHCCPPTFKLKRQSHVELNYLKHTQDLKKKKCLLKNHIYETQFSNKNNTRYSLSLNPFPYYIDDTITHYVLWIHPSFNSYFPYNIPSIFIDNIIQTYFTDQKKNIQDYIYFENLDSNKSIPEIRHLHIFVLI